MSTRTQRAGLFHSRIQGLLTLGGLAVAQGDCLSARPAFTRALMLSQSISFRSGEADSHYRLGQVATALQEEEVAASHLRQAQRIAAAAQEAPVLLDALCAVVHLLALHPQPDAALVVDWLLARPNLGEQRRNDLMALALPADAHTATNLTLNQAAELAASLLDRL